jgi:hypothetical protein
VKTFFLYEFLIDSNKLVSFQSPPNITVTTAASTTITNNNHQAPPATTIKKYDLSGPLIKKDPRRQVSSRFNVNKQSCEIESLPPLKGKCLEFHTVQNNID